MFCRNCGHELEEHQSFCPSCGFPVDPSAVPPARNTGPGMSRRTVTAVIVFSVLALAVLFAASSLIGDDEDDGHDPMLEQAVEVVIDAGQASTSLLQRRCKLGYARAARIMDEMEQKGIIGPYEGAKPRAVLISRQQWLEMNLNQPDNP